MLRLSAQINRIYVDNKPTKLRLLQKPGKTVVHTIIGEYREIKLPNRRYLHTVDEPFDGKAGLAQLEKELS